MPNIPLTAAEIAAGLATLPGWTFENDMLAKTYTFLNFREAMGFMVRVGFEAEALNHHDPEALLDVLKRRGPR